LGRDRSAQAFARCRDIAAGVCHTCESTLIAGGVDYDPDPVEQPADGSALICCSQPHGEIVLDL
jgi:ferredoxin